MDHDKTFMNLALRAALRGVGRTAPNPAVGAVVVKDGAVVSTGHHARAGEPHAEVVALRRAGEAAKGATLYVTLEPCCHTGRTPPCTDAIEAAGVAEVVYAHPDPSPHCRGEGDRCLRDARVRVRSGVLIDKARALNAPFFKRLESGLPLVTAKWAMTVDGKIATATGDARWVSGKATLALAHRLRRRCGAILVGIGTVLADDPLLTCRLPGSCPQPVRVVLDSKARLPLASALVASASEGPLVAVHGPSADRDRLSALRDAGAEMFEVRETKDGLDLVELCRALAAGKVSGRVIDHLLVEGGGAVHASFLRGQLVDRLTAVIAPKIVGGARAPTPVGGEGMARMADAITLVETTVRKTGPDIVLEGFLNRSTAR